MIKYNKEVYDIMNIENNPTTSVKTDVRKLPKELQDRLYEYTIGCYDILCDYSQFITDETQFYPLLLWDRDGKGMYHELTDEDKLHVEQLHELISNQPIEENNLKTEIRISKKGNENIVVHMPDGKERIILLEKWESGEALYRETIEHTEEKMERLEVYLEYVDDKK